MLRYVTSQKSDGLSRMLFGPAAGLGGLSKSLLVLPVMVPVCTVEYSDVKEITL